MDGMIRRIHLDRAPALDRGGAANPRTRELWTDRLKDQ
jgi:hypothetical protein